MKTATANAIKCLLRTDPTVTQNVRMAVIAAMRGDRVEAPEVNLSGEFSIADAADYLGMSRTTLWRMCDQGKLVAVRRGKKYFIAGCEIARLKRCAA